MNTLIPPDNHSFETGLRSWVQNSEIGLTHGATITQRLRETLIEISSSNQNRNTKSNGTTTDKTDDSNDIGIVEYEEQLTEMYKTMMDGLMSAVHRNIPYYHVNRSSSTGYHVTRDEEETLLRADPFESDEEEEYPSEAGDGDKQANVSQQSPPQQTAAPDQRCKKREDLRKRRLEDEDLLINQRMVRDEKGNMLVTIGPFPPPRLTIRSAKPNQCFPSRKTLQQRLNAEQAIDLSEQEETEQTSVATSSTAQPGYDASTHLSEFLKSLSMESIKKVSESAKVKIKPSNPPADFIAQIVKAAIRYGCDKATQLMDRKLSQANTPLNLAARASIQFIETLSNEVKEALSLGLGLTPENSSSPEIWERIISIGLLSILNNLRIRPLKKISQELSLELADLPSTEKYCEAIVFGCFPMEKIRVRNSQKAKQHIGVAFNAPPSKMRCMGDMGMITFRVINISRMRKDNERHYSPEFEFGGLKWSVLCMNNKESLALYLCQTGTVYCKFFIQLQNKEPDDVIGNEGAQRFNSTSAENDWGFNNILKFDQLLEPQQGFWNEKDDSISIELGIAFVEVQNGVDGKGDSVHKDQGGSANGSGGGSGAGKGKKSQQKINEDVAAAAAQLLEQERLEKERKKIKQLLTSTQKEEEKDRKDLQTKRTKGIADIMDSHRQEVKRIVKEQKEFEKREQLERAKEQERIQRAHEQNVENQRKIESLTEENQELEEKKESLREGLITMKEELSNAKISLADVEEEIQQYSAKVKLMEKRAKEREAELEELSELEPPTPEEPVDDQEKELRGELDALLAGI
eukprot:Tbor_TRINITY_DN6174_c1_g1::TRINITY_DN6174_c1_g1_i1::g.21400::m.21400